MGGFLKSQGYTFQQRKMYFYTICITFRLILSWYVYNNKNINLHIPILAFSLLGVFLNSKKNRDIWWSRNFHFINSIFIACLSFMGIFNLYDHIILSQVIGVILFIDVLIGIIHSFFHFKSQRKYPNCTQPPQAISVCEPKE